MAMDWTAIGNAITSAPVITASIISVIGIIINIVFTTKYTESVKTKNQISVEDRKGEITAEVNRQLEQFKQDYDRNKVTEDRKHQIAQEAYKEFFNSKMKAYLQLVKLKQEYYTDYNLRNFSPNNYDPTDYVAKEKIEAIIKHVDDNEIYLSENLMNKFYDWYLPASQELDRRRIKIELHEYADLEPLEQQEIKQTYETKTYAKYESKFVDFLDELDLDIKVIRKKYDL